MTEEAKTEGLKEMNIQDIMACIPHRYPFLLVDKIVDIVPFKSGTGIKNVTMNEEFFQGHFPGHPVMPGVLLVEAMAQAAGAVIIGSHGKGAGKDKIVYFMSLDSVKFRKTVVPGDVLHMKVELVKQRGAVHVFEGKTYVNDVLYAEAGFTAMIFDKKEEK